MVFIMIVRTFLEIIQNVVVNQILHPVSASLS